MPCVNRSRSVPFDTIGEVAAKAVHPFPDRFPADHDTPIGEKVFDVRRTEREAMEELDGICDDFSREAVAFQAGHGGWSAHQNRLDSHETPNKLAMPVRGSSSC